MRWDGFVVTQFQALQRFKGRQPVVQRDNGPNRRFVCSLSTGDTILIREDDGAQRLMLVQSVSQSGKSRNVEFTPMNDARQDKKMKKQKGNWRKRSPESLRELGMQKVIVTPLGDVRRAND